MKALGIAVYLFGVYYLAAMLLWISRYRKANRDVPLPKVNDPDFWAKTERWQRFFDATESGPFLAPVSLEVWKRLDPERYPLIPDPRDAERRALEERIRLYETRLKRPEMVQ